MTRLIDQYWIVRGPTTSDAKFFQGRMDGCALDVRRHGHHGLLILRLRIVNVITHAHGRQSLTGHPFTMPRAIVHVNTNARTGGQGHITWSVDCFGPVDPTSYLIVAP